MFSKLVTRQARFSTASASLKFPEGTVAGFYKQAVADNAEYDVVRFDSQKLNWTLKEFDMHSSAFAHGLLEAGFAQGDKIVLYVDQTTSAENLVAQMGAIKAGVSIVTFDEKENADALDDALGSSQAKGLIISPSTHVDDGETTRKTFLDKLIPELATSYFGDELNSSKYPHLKTIVQTEHNQMRGVNKFRDIAVYTPPSMSSRQIPENHGDSVTHIAFNGSRQSEFTSQQMVNQAQSLWDDHLWQTKQGDHANQPVFMPCDLETPFGFAAFLSLSSNAKKMFIPGTFNVSTMLKSVPRQGSTFVVCDEDLYTVEMPQASASSYQEMCKDITGVLVAGNASQTSQLFKNATAQGVNKFLN